MKADYMSQHRFIHGDWEVLYGWDEPLEYFFLVIEDSKNLRDGFSNLDLSDPAMTINQIKETLNKFDIPVPDDLEKTLLRDELHGTLTHTDSPLQSWAKKMMGWKKR